MPFGRFALFGGFFQNHLRADNQIAVQFFRNLAGQDFAFVERETQYIGGVIFAAVVAVVGSGFFFVQKNQADVGAAVFIFQGRPRPAVEIAFGWDAGGGRGVFKVQMETLPLQR